MKLGFALARLSSTKFPDVDPAAGCIDAQEPGSATLLNDQTWSAVFSWLSTTDLARSRAVCTSWKDLIDCPEIRRALFRKHWLLADIQDEPRHPGFYLSAGLSNFAWGHRCSRQDTLSGLAVKYGVTPLAIKMTNNLISDQGLQSRDTIYVPVSSHADLCGKRGTFIYDMTACRELVLVTEPDGSNSSAFPLDAKQPVAADQSTIAALSRKLSRMLGRGLRIEEGTAKFYLDVAEGNLKDAIALYEQDMAWEQTHKGKRRSS
ncbi:hypothetical protein ABBQ32_013699 [Trebouxia sp. C0010 RCD-2024]